MNKQISFFYSSIAKAVAVLVLIMGFYFSTAPTAFASNYASFTDYSGIVTIDSDPKDYLLFTLDPDWTAFPWVCHETSPTLGGDINEEPSSFWLDCITDDPLDPGYNTVQHWNFSISSPGTLIYNSNTTATTRNHETYYLTEGIPLGFDSEIFLSNPITPRLQLTYFNFTGKFHNANFEYDTLEIQSFDSSSELYRTHTLELCNGVPCSMYNVPFSVPSSLYLAGNYTYKARLKNDTSSTDWTTPIPFTVVLSYTPSDVYSTDLDFTECSTLEIFCHLKNVAVWFFGISDSTLEQFASLTLENSFPFSYIYDVPVLFSDLVSSSPASVPSVVIPIGSESFTLFSSTSFSSSPVASTIRTFLTYAIWFLFVYAVYRRATTFFDEDTVE